MIKEQYLYNVPLYIILESITKIVINDISELPIDKLINMIKSQHSSIMILEGKFNGEQPKNFFQLIHLNCVSIIKKSLGINKPFIITPKQLCKYLIGIGYKEI